MSSRSFSTCEKAALEKPAVTSPAPRGDWRQLLAADQTALAFHTPEWMDAMVATGKYEDCSRLYEFSSGRRLLLPLARRRGSPAWMTGEASMPDSWGMGGLVGLQPLCEHEVAAVFQDLRRRSMVRVGIRPNPLHHRVWTAARPRSVLVEPRLAHVLDLEGGFGKVWSDRFASETRTAVRKAERSGVEVTCDRLGEHIPAFYELLMLSVERWADQQNEPLAMARMRAEQRDPIEKFYAIARTLDGAFQLWTAWKDGQAVASILVLMGRNASYTRGAMNKTLAGPLRANQLLHRMAIEAACEAGAHHYHMGESGFSSSLAQFKTRFGAVPVEYSSYNIEQFPVTQIDTSLRSLVKALIGFKDTP